MRIEYDFTKEDYMAFSIHHLETSPTVKRSLFIQRYFVSLIFIVFPFIIASYSNTSFIPWLMAYGIIFVLWIRFYPKYYISSTKKRIESMLSDSKNASLFGPYSITLTDEGIEEENPNGESSISWRGVERIDETESHIYIFTSAINAYIVPKSAFQDRLHQAAFMEILKNKRNLPT